MTRGEQAWHLTWTEHQSWLCWWKVQVSQACGSESRRVAPAHSLIRHGMSLPLTPCHLWQVRDLTSMKWEKDRSFHLSNAAIQRADPAACLGKIVEVTLVLWVWQAGLKGVRAAKLVSLHAVCYIGWDIQGNAEELTWVDTYRKSWQAEQTSYHPGPESGLWDGPPQHPPCCWTAEACKGSRSTATGSSWHKIAIVYPRGAPMMPSVTDIADARGLEPNQWLSALNTYK